MDARIIRAPTPGSIFLARPPWRSYSGTQRATNHLHADKESAVPCWAWPKPSARTARRGSSTSAVTAASGRIALGIETQQAGRAGTKSTEGALSDAAAEGSVLPAASDAGRAPSDRLAAVAGEIATSRQRCPGFLAAGCPTDLTSICAAAGGPFRVARPFWGGLIQPTPSASRKADFIAASSGDCPVHISNAITPW